MTLKNKLTRAVVSSVAAGVVAASAVIGTETVSYQADSPTPQEVDVQLATWQTPKDFSDPHGVNNYAENNIVVFGDSLFANPMAPNNPITGNLGGNKNGYPSVWNNVGCASGTLSIASELRTKTPRPVSDYTCLGGGVTINTKNADFVEAVNHAITSGAINPTTGDVVISIGLVDYNTLNAFQGTPVRFGNTQGTQQMFVDTMKQQVARMRAINPNVKVHFATYPSISAPNGAVCPIRSHLDGNNVGFNLEYTGFFKAFEDNTSYSLWRSATETGSDYIDLRDMTKFKNMCAPDSERIITGVYEETQDHNMKFHLTHKGVREVADMIAQRIL